MDIIERAVERLDKIDAVALPVPTIEKAEEYRENKKNESVVTKEDVSLEEPVFYSPASPSRSGKQTKHSINLDLEQIRKNGMVVPDDERSLVKEEFRHIKRPLLMNAAGKGATVAEYANLIMVTSAKPAEGKTFTALSLALSIASERDQTVLLVDADVVKPNLSKFFGLKAELGLVDYLIDDSLDLSDILVQTDIPSFKILPAGNTHHLSTELLASNSMRRLAQELSKRYSDRIVIFDSPPLLLTNEASVLATLVGQVVMVVEAEKTRQAQVKEALAMLNPNMIVGLVLNKSQRSLGSGYYGYRSYKYGHYGYYGLES